MTSELTRERLQEIAEDGFLKHGEGKELARIALAAMDSEPVVFTDERNLHHIAMGRETSLIWGKQNQEAGDIAIYRHAQPAPALPDFDDVLESLDYEVRCNAWESEHVLKACQATYDACRAAMLQELQKSAGAEATCRSNENVQVLHTKSPAQSDCCRRKTTFLRSKTATLQRKARDGFRLASGCRKVTVCILAGMESEYWKLTASLVASRQINSSMEK